MARLYRSLRGPLTPILQITAEQIAAFREHTQCMDNPAYQPQNHEEACRELGIPNPEQPRMDGLLDNLKFEYHQPTAICALTRFEDSCVEGGLLAEDVGLGKSVEMIGHLLHRSNQRRDAIDRGDDAPNPKALPTMIDCDASESHNTMA